jgi:hypothetical protein
MVSRKKDKPWHLKFTWSLSILMLLLIGGFFYQSFEEVRKITPVKVAAGRMSETIKEDSEKPGSKENAVDVNQSNQELL